MLYLLEYVSFNFNLFLSYIIFYIAYILLLFLCLFTSVIYAEQLDIWRILGPETKFCLRFDLFHLREAKKQKPEKNGKEEKNRTQWGLS